jgi:hypothetical protein
MIGVIAVLLALQGDPRIERVEPILGNVNRPYLWTPFKVTVACDADFDGDVVARSGFGFGVARRLTLKAGGRTTVLLPALNPEEIIVGKTRFRMPEKFVRPERIVLVDSRLPFASDLVATDKILYQKILPEDLQKTLPRGLLEAADLVLVQEPLGRGVVAKTREDADRAVAELKEPLPALELMDRAVWSLAPQQRWVPAKRNWTVYFATVYGFAAFVALTVVAKRYPKFGLASLAGVALLGMAGFVVFPRSHLWIVGNTAEVIPAAGEAQEQRLWFVQSALEMTVKRIEFPRLVKPVFPSRSGADDAFTIRVDERGCSVEGLKLRAGQPACFGGVEGRPASTRGPLNPAILVRGGRDRYLGPLAAGTPIPAEVGEGGIFPGTQFESWKRFVGSNGLFGVVEGARAEPGQVKSADLVDEVERPKVFIQRFP